MNNALIATVRTVDGSSYHIIEHADFRTHTVCLGNGLSATRPTLAAALFCLGGVVDWASWDEASREKLASLNGGQAI